MIAEIELGERGLVYVTEQLELGHTLAQLALQHHDLTRGRVVALLPKWIPPEEILDPAFEFDGIHQRGALEAGDAWDAWQYLVSRVDSYNRQAPGRCVVMENSMSRADDERHYRPTGQTILFHDQEVYHFVDARYTDREAIRDVIATATFYPGIGFFTAWPAPLPTPAWYGEIGRDYLEALVQQTTGIIIAAYDQQSWLIWWRERS